MIDIVIVNWNSGDQLRQIVESVCVNSNGLVSKLVVVDNNSTDHSLETVQHFQTFGGVNIQFVENSKNLGFGAACNKGAQYCNSDYVLFLNPDALLFEDTLTKVYQFMEQKEQASIGICGIQLVNEQGIVVPTCARFPSALHFAMGSLGLDRLKSFKKYAVHQYDWDHSESKIVDHVIGAFYFVRNKVFTELNGFDERFFVYLEDLDFSFRAFQLGWKSYYLTGVKAFHKGGGTSEQVKATRLFYSLRSKIQYAHKHLSVAGSLVVFVVTLLLEPFVRMAYSIQKLSFNQFSETVFGYVQLYTWSFRKLMGLNR